MIIVEAGQRDARSFDAKILFAIQLENSGYSVVIDEKSLPEKIDRGQKYEAARFLADISEVDVTGLILIGAENISDETLMALRSYPLEPDAPVSATGRFPDYQSLVASSSKIAFSIGREANVIDLNELQNQQLLPTSIVPLVASEPTRVKTADRTQELFIFIPPEWLEDPFTLPVLAAMEHQRGFNLNIVISGIGKEEIRKSKYASLSVFGLAELSPTAFAGFADMLVFYGDGIPGERMANFALDLMRSGGTVIDCTHKASFVSSGAPAVRGPEDISALSVFLDQTVLPNIGEIGAQSQTSEWIENHSIARLETALGLTSSARVLDAEQSPAKTMFIPTNGNGLGHAQRCSLVASAMTGTAHIEFSAFPSCIGLINQNGFPCRPLVQKSPSHADEFANDLVNYLRLKRTLQSGDHLVFDGGYVFDSIYRTIIEKSLTATWIRRGLWQPGQVRQSAFNREKVFTSVIVPGEAFEELNIAYTFGDRIHRVGPILQRSDRTAKTNAALKSDLSKSLNHDFKELVVTMLGGGVAADRSAQTQILCAMMERRPDCLHLVVVWPGSKVSAGLSGWKNSRVVKTRNALALCQAADLVVSAVGYNSFHELMYHAIPSILIPQTAAFMDDQELRARAASDRDLAATVLGHELLLLEREVTAFLDDGKAATIRQSLGEATLPATGNVAAAAIIEEG